MIGIGFGEMILLAGIALIVIGPEKFPDFAKVVVRTIRDLRGYMDEVKKELSEELKPVEEEMRSLTRPDARSYSRPAAPPARPAVTNTPAPQETAPATEGPDQSASAAPPSLTPYGGYSPEQDEDYDHSAENEAPGPDHGADAGQDGAEPASAGESEGGGEGVTEISSPDRLDG